MTRREKILVELQEVQVRHGGTLRPADVVAFAEDGNTALHERFTWDDTKAAHEHRLWQARELIRVSVILLPGETEPVRAFVSLKEDRAKAGGGYRGLVDVLLDPAGRKAMMMEAKAEWEAFTMKYKRLAELAPLFRQGKRLFKALRKRRAG